MTDFGGNLPNYGDGDEGKAIQLSYSGYRRDSWIFELSNELLDTNLPIHNGQNLSAVFFNCNKTAEKKYVLEESKAFEDAGIYILSRNRNKENEIFLMADAGPLGLGPLFAHGHADALSFTLSYKGVPFIIDPGTYCYHTEYEWRKYFRGTNAHNTIVIENQDQAIQEGSFLWSDIFNAKVLQWDKNGLTAEQNGYERLGVTHRRSFSLEKNSLTITDILKGEGKYYVKFPLHFSPDVSLDLEDQCVRSFMDDCEMLIYPDTRFSLNIITGGTGYGWYSPEFESKVTTNSLIMKNKLTLPVELTTEIKFK